MGTNNQSVADIMDRKDILLKEIDLIQTRIEKIEKTSFTIKGWTVTLIAAVLAILPKNSNKMLTSFLVGIATLAFWYLDSFFLRVDRLYRWKYNWVTAYRMNDKTGCFDLDPYNKKMILKPEDPNDKKIPCCISLMFSDTLIIFYLPIIVLAVAYVIIK